jgi:methyl-accepting chemotaxis protein
MVQIKAALSDIRSSVDDARSSALAAFAAATNEALVSAWGGASLALLLALCAAWLIFGSIGKPIERLARYANDIAEGHYSTKFEMKRTDEFGQLARSIKRMVENMISVIARADAKTSEAEEHAQRAAQSLAHAEEARSEAAQATRRGILEAAERLESIVAESSNVSKALAKSVDEALTGTEKQLEYAAESATAMTQMYESIIDVARNASESADKSVEARHYAEAGAEVVHTTITAIDKLRQNSLAMQENMSGLGKQIEGVGHVMGVISDIADQTNLLALNAAIEAARAGDAGRGFAVVADEVRKLAEKTMLATKEVREVVSGIQRSATESTQSVSQAVEMVERSTELAGQAGDSLAQIVRNAIETAEKIGAIAAASDEQSTACDEISKGSDEIRRLAEANASLMHQSDRVMQDMSGLITRLTNLLVELKNT